MAAKALPSIEYLRECFDIDPQTGILTWKVRPSYHFKTQYGADYFNKRYPGKRALGSKNKKGYYSGTMIYNGKSQFLSAHRVACALYTNTTNILDVDHKNRNPSDNSISNLRSATRTQNLLNSKSRNKAGLPRGVRISGRKFAANTNINGKMIYLGTFDTSEEAEERVKAANASRA